MATATAKTAQQEDANDEAERQLAEGQQTEPQVDEDPEVAVEATDERLGGGRDEEADKAERAAKAQERRARKERQRLARERLQNENTAYRTRVEQLERVVGELHGRVTKNDGDTIEARLNDVRQKIEQATVIQAKAARATGANAEQDYIEATRIRDQLLKAEATLEQAKAWQGQPREPERQAPQRVPVPAEIVRQAQAFASENDWYAPQGAPGRNRESEIADRISANLDAEGYDPKTAEYWSEFRARCKSNRSIGHLVADAEDDDTVTPEDDEPAPRPVQRSAPRMSAGGREAPLKRGQVQIPRALKESMEEAGIWDNPQARNRVIKNYQASLRAQRQH